MTLVCLENFTWLEIIMFLAPALEKLDGTIHWTNCYPVDTYYKNQLRYPLDSNLSSG